MRWPAPGLLVLSLLSWLSWWGSACGSAPRRDPLPLPPFHVVKTSTAGFDVPIDRETGGGWFGIIGLGPVRGYQKASGQRLGPGAARWAMVHEDGSRWNVECRARLEGDGHMTGCYAKMEAAGGTQRSDRMLLVLLAEGERPVRGLFADGDAVVPLTGFRRNEPVDTHLLFGDEEGYGYVSRGPGDPDAARFRTGTPKSKIESAVPMALLLAGMFDPRSEGSLPERGFVGSAAPWAPPGDLSVLLGADAALNDAVRWVLSAVSAPAEGKESLTASRWTRQLRLADSRGSLRLSLAPLVLGMRAPFGGQSSSDAALVPSSPTAVLGTRLRVEAPYGFGGFIGADIGGPQVDLNDVGFSPTLGGASFGVLGGVGSALFAAEPFVVRWIVGGRFEELTAKDDPNGIRVNLRSAGAFLGLDVLEWPSTSNRDVPLAPRFGLQLGVNRRLGRSVNLDDRWYDEPQIETLDRFRDQGRLSEWWFDFGLSIAVDLYVFPRQDIRSALIEREPGQSSPPVRD